VRRADDPTASLPRNPLLAAGERDGPVVAAFDRGADLLTVSPRRLAAVDTVHAMTIHKGQGSQFDTVAVVLPDAESPISRANCSTQR
jgi:exodeoxyribonuclease V alpha subunit